MTVMHAKNVDQVTLQIIENALTVKTGLGTIVSFVQLEVVQHVAKDGSLVMDNVKSVDLQKDVKTISAVEMAAVNVKKVTIRMKASVFHVVQLFLGVSRAGHQMSVQSARVSTSTQMKVYANAERREITSTLIN